MTLLDYIEGLDGRFLIAGYTAWSVEELRVRLRAVALGAEADRRAFPEGYSVHVVVGDGTPGTPVPREVDIDVMVPSEVEGELRERLDPRPRPAGTL